jgi:hypothetical protein
MHPSAGLSEPKSIGKSIGKTCVRRRGSPASRSRPTGPPEAEHHECSSRVRGRCSVCLAPACAVRENGRSVSTLGCTQAQTADMALSPRRDGSTFWRR